MSDCVTSLASKAANYQTLQAARKTLGIAKDDPWWNYPNSHKADDEYVWSSEGKEDGILFQPPSSFQVAFYLKREIEAIPEKLRTIKGELATAGGDFKFSPARIEEIGRALDRAIEELDSALSSQAMDGGYGGRNTGMFPTSYFITFGEFADVKYVQAQISAASSQVDQILSILFVSNCTETPDDGDNCDRIAAALEALAAKEFNCEGLEEIAAAVGADALAAGVTVPRLMTEADGGGTVTLKSIPEFIRWQFLQMDALIGRFPIKIKVQDSEIDEAGDQSKEFVAPNLSEAMATLIGLAVTNDAAVDAILKGTMTACTEIVSNRIVSIKSHAMIQSLEEWASYTVKEETRTVPFAFDIEAKSIDQALDSKKKEIQVSTWDASTGQKNGDFDIERIGKIVNTIYAIVSTAFLHRVDPNNPEIQIKEDLKKMQNTIDDEDEDDFSIWLERTEIEFSDADASRHQTQSEVNPYGRPLGRRPRLRQIEGQGDEDIRDGQDGSP